MRLPCGLYWVSLKVLQGIRVFHGACVSSNTVLLWLVFALEKGVDFLPVGQTSYAFNHSEIRRSCVRCLQRVRLLVVFNEGRDFCSLNRKSCT